MNVLTRLRCLMLTLLLVCGGVVAPNAAALDMVVYYHNDTAGSPVAATDSNGNLAWREHYQPYGDRVVKQPAGNNQLWFHNKPQDEQTGLSYFGARYYDPVVGRFMGVDPQHFDEDNLHSFYNPRYRSRILFHRMAAGKEFDSGTHGTIFVAFRDAQRVASEHGGNAADWAKKTSSSFTDGKGTRFETHWVENIKTGQRFEFKTKFPE